MRAGQGVMALFLSGFLLVTSQEMGPQIQCNLFNVALASFCLLGVSASCWYW